MSERRKLFLFTALIVICIVVLIVVLMETTGLGTGEPGNPTTTTSGDTSISSSNGQTSGSMGEANSTSEEPKEIGYPFSHTDIFSGTLIYVDAQTSTGSNTFGANLYDMRLDTDGTSLFRIRGQANKRLNEQAATEFLNLVKAYRAAVSAPVTLEVSRAFDTNANDDYSTALAIQVGILENTISYGLRHGNFTARTTWLFENMHTFGFIYVAETETAGHLRYVGVPHATYIYENNLTLRTYLETVRAYTYATPLEVTVNGQKYVVYYVPASGSGDFYGIVPNAPYTPSGDNLGGVIITVPK